ncbi:Uncharacterised protein [Vibrio cholerae]|nr:Uncharacterised protein [Vibrio cholerae]CSI79846.1 Uncharacterised protein [Vibrio cholerae]
MPFSGIANPITTPANVAWTPDFNTAIHRMRPATK